MINTLVFISVAAAVCVGSYAALALWENAQRRRLLALAAQAESAPETADAVYWGNDSLLLIHAANGVVVAATGGIAKRMPPGSILESSAFGGGDGGGVSRLVLTLNDVAHPEITLVFPGDGAMQAHASITSLMNALASSAAPPAVPEDVAEGEGGEAVPPGEMESEPAKAGEESEEAPTIILLGREEHGEGGGEGVVIGDFNRRSG